MRPDGGKKRDPPEAEGRIRLGTDAGPRAAAPLPSAAARKRNRGQRPNRTVTGTKAGNDDVPETRPASSGQSGKSSRYKRNGAGTPRKSSPKISTAGNRIMARRNPSDRRRATVPAAWRAPRRRPRLRPQAPRPGPARLRGPGRCGRTGSGSARCRPHASAARHDGPGACRSPRHPSPSAADGPHDP